MPLRSLARRETLLVVLGSVDDYDLGKLTYFTNLTNLKNGHLGMIPLTNHHLW